MTGLCTGGGGGSAGLGPCTTVTVGTRGWGLRSIALSTIARCSDGLIRRGGGGSSMEGRAGPGAGPEPGPGPTGRAGGAYVRGRASGGRED